MGKKVRITSLGWDIIELGIQRLPPVPPVNGGIEIPIPERSK